MHTGTAANGARDRGTSLPVTLARTPVVAASVDVGSNSVHLLAAVVAGHRLVPLVDESELLGLGATVDAEGRLGTARRTELVSVLARYVETARQLGCASVALVGTEPLRVASDADRVVEDVRKATDETLNVVTHEEEAFLTLIGVTAGRRVPAELGVIDVGGGSSEVAIVAPSRPAYAGGIAARLRPLTARFVEHDPPTKDEIEAMRAHAREAMAEAPAGTPRVFIAVGGTATNLLRVMPEAALDSTLSRARLAEALAVLSAEPSRGRGDPARRATCPCADPAGRRRSSSRRCCERYGLEMLRVSDAGIREGAIFAQRHLPSKWRARLPVLAEGWSR